MYSFRFLLMYSLDITLGLWVLITQCSFSGIPKMLLCCRSTFHFLVFYLRIMNKSLSLFVVFFTFYRKVFIFIKLQRNELLTKCARLTCASVFPSNIICE